MRTISLTAGTSAGTVGPPTFGRLNGLAFHKNGYGITGIYKSDKSILLMLSAFGQNNY